MHQQNPPVLNWRCQLMKDDLYNGCKTVFFVVVLMYVIQYVCVTFCISCISHK